jgi:alkylation response protein AidB-like acyl-CoA dehydrogenase
VKFSLTESQAEIQQLANKILQEQVTEERLRNLDKQVSGERFDRDLWQQLASAGLLGVAIDESHGGMGFDYFSLSLLLEEVGRSVAAVPVVTSLAGAAMLLTEYASAELQQQWLPDVVNGQSILTVAFSEAMSTNDVTPHTVTATNNGSDYSLNGVKHYVPYAQHAAGIIVSAKISDDENVLVMIDPSQAGVTLDKLDTTTAEPQSKLTLANVMISSSQVLAVGEKANQAIQYGVNCLLTAYCNVQLGASEAALRMTAKYTSERKQFNTAIASFQAVAQRAADGYIDVECLRLCTQQAACLLSNKASDLESQRVINDAVTMAKIWAGDTGHRISYTAQHLHGGTGVDREYPLWRFCLLLRQMEFSMGSSQQHLTNLGDRIAEYSVSMA